MKVIKISKSSTISHLGYDKKTKTLMVTFHGGFVYHYANISAKLCNRLYGAESRGSFFARVIKANPLKYPYTKEMK